MKMNIGVISILLFGVAITRQGSAATNEARPGDPYIAMLQDLKVNPYNADARIEATNQAIRAIDNDAVLEDVIKTMQEDPDYWRRVLAASVLDIAQKPQTAPALIEVMQNDSRWEVRRNAVIALGDLPTDPAIGKALYARYKRNFFGLFQREEQNELVLDQLKLAAYHNKYFDVPQAKLNIPISVAFSELSNFPREFIDKLRPMHGIDKQ